MPAVLINIYKQLLALNLRVNDYTLEHLSLRGDYSAMLSQLVCLRLKRFVRKYIAMNNVIINTIFFIFFPS